MKTQYLVLVSSQLTDFPVAVVDTKEQAEALADHMAGLLNVPVPLMDALGYPRDLSFPVTLAKIVTLENGLVKNRKRISKAWRPQTQTEHHDQYDHCHHRWEDDGGRPHPKDTPHS